MPLNYLQFRELSETGRAEFRRQKPEVDPTVRGSWARAFVDSCAAVASSLMLLVRDLETQLFPQTAEGEFLDLWGGYEGLKRNPASPAFGTVNVSGVNATPLPLGTVFTGANGIEYATTAAGVVEVRGQSVVSLQRIGSTVTATTPSAHELATGQTVTMAGANEAEYNGAFSITVLSETQFQYTISSQPATPATGTITLSATYAIAPVLSAVGGQASNLSAGSALSTQTEIAGIDGTALVNFSGISGGADIETDELYRARILLSRSTQEGVFTADQIKLAALGVPGNTRAFVVSSSDTIADVVRRGISQELVLNGDFEDGSTNWSLQSGWSVASGEASIDGSNVGFQTIIQSGVAINQSSNYVTSYTVSNYVSGSVFIRLGLGFPEDRIDGVTVSQNGVVNEVLTTTPTSADGILIAAADSTELTIDNISVRELDPPSVPLPGGIPAPGQVAVYVLRDNDDNIIPSQQVIDATKEAIVENGRLPAHTSSDDVFVLAPVPNSVNVELANISPDTQSMRAAIQAQLEALFEDDVDFEESVTLLDLQCAIRETQDLTTGDRLAAFTLNTPSADVVVQPGEIAILGTVTYV